MLTLYYAPMTRATRIMTLIEDLGVADKIDTRLVSILRRDGTGARDAANPHPEGKVPFLIHNGAEIRESTAIALYLTELFPEAGLGRPIGHPERGPLLSWLAWYGDVLEPLVVMDFAGVDSPLVHTTWRGMAEAHTRIDEALADGREFLLKGGYSIADLIVSSTFAWAPAVAPKSETAKAWLARCQARPAVQSVWEREVEMQEAQVAAA